MIKIGQMNTLTVVKEVEFGVFVDGGREYGNILLPKRYVPKARLSATKSTCSSTLTRKTMSLPLPKSRWLKWVSSPSYSA